MLGKRYLGRSEIKRVESSQMELLSYKKKKKVGLPYPFCYVETQQQGSI